ncbi:unnamed protein product [Cladocopium goreaui]|uniref:C3H1-type domain-containing protein n=1 Tax=Cladocopium goreaui TaxID=2562237 RepID=A0A9P1CN15_9DINO|nr:unnamed protein product [Cladocopium goreaui]
MATLRYFNTFIDEEPIGNLLESRSKSWPQLGGTGHATEEIEKKETQAANYVAELQGKWSTTFGERQSPMSPKPQPTRSANKGSRGHPVVCRRPCIRFAKGGCELGDACGYCHHEHPGYVAPNKRQRVKLDYMETGELLAVLLPHVRRSIEVAQIEATNIIEMLEGEVGSTQAPSVDRLQFQTGCDGIKVFQRLRLLCCVVAELRFSKSIRCPSAPTVELDMALESWNGLRPKTKTVLRNASRPLRQDSDPSSDLFKCGESFDESFNETFEEVFGRSVEVLTLSRICLTFCADIVPLPAAKVTVEKAEKVDKVKLGIEALNGLNDAAVHAHDVATAALDEVKEVKTLSKDDKVLPSKGSATHGSGKCRPCAWYWKPQGCQNDKDCGYCHLCPEGELKNRKKSKVAAMRMGALVPASKTHKTKSYSGARVLKLSPLL